MKIYDIKNWKKIGYPRTPCRWIGKEKVKTVTLVRMSCGGGMGGASWLEILEKTEVQPGLNKYKRVDGSFVTLNGNFIVDAEDRKMLVLDYVANNPSLDDGETHERVGFIGIENGYTIVDGFSDWQRFDIICKR